MPFDLQRAREEASLANRDLDQEELEIAQYLSDNTGFDLQGAINQDTANGIDPRISVREINDYLAPRLGVVSNATVQTPKAGNTENIVEEFNLAKTFSDTIIEAGDLVERHISNIPRNAPEFAKMVTEPFLHPIQTARTVRDITEGALQKVIKQPSRLGEELFGFKAGSGFFTQAEIPEQVFDVFYDGMVDRYGSIEAIKEHFAERPLEFWTDFGQLTVAAGKLLKTSKVGKLSKAGETLTKIGNRMQPANLAFDVTGGALNLTGTAGKFFLDATEGVGRSAIQGAFDRLPPFVAAVKDQTKLRDLVKNARKSLNEIRKIRGAAYRPKLLKLKENKKLLDFEPIRKKMYELVKEDGALRTTVKGKLNTDNSTYGRRSSREVKQMFKIIDKWDNRPQNLTPGGFDILKQKINDFWTEGEKSSVFSTKMSGVVYDAIVDGTKDPLTGISPYPAMTKPYRELTDLYQEAKRTFGIKSKTAADSIAKKLIRTIETDNEIGLQLLDEINAVTKIDLKSEAAGRIMRNIGPQSFRGAFLDMSAGAALIGYSALSGLSAVDPLLATGLIFAVSPRLTSKFLNVLGNVTRKTQKVTTPIRSALPTGFQVGRAGIIAGQEFQLSEPEQ
jgi:hypothetical protein